MTNTSRYFRPQHVSGGAVCSWREVDSGVGAYPLGGRLRFSAPAFVLALSNTGGRSTMLALNRPAVSSFCAADSAQCVEVTYTERNVGLFRRARTFVQLRDTKLGDASPVVEFTKSEWHEFIEIAPKWWRGPDGYRIGDLRFDADEWLTFCKAVAVGEFTLPTTAAA